MSYSEEHIPTLDEYYEMLPYEQGKVSFFYQLAFNYVNPYDRKTERRKHDLWNKGYEYEKSIDKKFNDLVSGELRHVPNSTMK